MRGPNPNGSPSGGGRSTAPPGRPPTRSGDVTHFAEWDDRRDEICHAIEGLGDAAVGAAEFYEEIEHELVRALRGEI